MEPQLYAGYLSIDDTWLLMIECADCYAIIPALQSNFEHNCPDNVNDMGRDSATLGHIISQATVFYKLGPIYNHGLRCHS